MKILIIDNYCHYKNKIEIINTLNHLKYNYKLGSFKDIPNYDIIYSSSEPINTSSYPTKKFIFGPHFSVFPYNKLKFINNIYNNVIYIRPSEWTSNVWRNMTQKIPIKLSQFCLDTHKFNTINKNKTENFIYFKQRDIEELKFLKIFLRDNVNVNRIFNYNSNIMKKTI